MKIQAVPADTTPEAAHIQLEIYRRMPPAKRLELACRMSDSVRAIAADGVRQRHPHYAPDQVRLAVIRLTLGDELFQEVYPGVDVDV